MGTLYTAWAISAGVLLAAAVALGVAVGRGCAGSLIDRAAGTARRVHKLRQLCIHG
jgi:hypothetical protein